ncbi:modification methylase-like protein [Novymonas esmeraldas]|uniref:DNA (cytosine-5-)-methyltransferase n=1 Tax=Novymonas esmeraldas TaxID=1808958 RepID=A0AAW0F4Y2_9TRYP
MASASVYPTSYPAGIFVVRCAQELAPLVARLRTTRQLKSGGAVTDFDAAQFAEVAVDAAGVSTPSLSDAAPPPPRPTAPADAQPLLTETVVLLHERTQSEASQEHPTSQELASTTATRDAGVDAAQSSAHSRAASLESAIECVGLVTACGAAEGQRLLDLLRLPRERRDLTQWPRYTAVHVVGAFTEAELCRILVPDRAAGGSGGAVAYARGVRRFHRVCCPRLSELPSALAAMRRAALLQCRTRVRTTGEVGFTFSELFGGIGMFRSGLERVGGRATFAVECAPPAQMVYALNHRCWHDCPASLQLPNARDDRDDDDDRDDRAAAPVLVGDITEIPSAFFPAHDVLTGGFPCQSFAKAGDAAGLHADKGWLFYEVVRVLAATRPAAFLLENVEHLVEVEAGAQLAEVLARLRRPSATAGAEAAEVHYDVQHVVLDGAAVSPQTRRRVYFLGLRAAPPGAGDGAAARVVADALQRIAVAAAEAPYPTVEALLVAASTLDAPRPQRRHGDSALSGTPAGAPPSAADEAVWGPSSGEHLRLTSAQWEAVRRSRTYRRSPLWRLCDVRGRARTVLGSYRTSYQLYSEFVPFAPELTVAEVVTTLVAEAAQTRRDGDAEEREERTDGGSVACVVAAGTAPPPPPLRFLALRECARLQGMDDSVVLPHDTTTAAGGLVSAAVLRQVPPGAVYRLIGNAVNPRVIACLGGAIAAYLEESRR